MLCVLDRKIESALVAGYDFVFRSVIHKHSAHVFHHRDKQNVANENRKHQTAFDKAVPKAFERRGRNCGDIVANKRCKEVWQKHEQTDRKQHAKHHRKAHKDVHGIDFELVGNPLVKLGRLGIIAVNFRRTHHYARALKKLCDKIYDAANKRQT